MGILRKRSIWHYPKTKTSVQRRISSNFVTRLQSLILYCKMCNLGASGQFGPEKWAKFKGQASASLL